MRLIRDNALFGDLHPNKKSRKSRRRRDGDDDDAGALKSTLDDDEGLGTRLEELRLRDRMEYEASREAVRRHRLPVEGRALRRGMLASADRPRSAIDLRRTPSEHVLTARRKGHIPRQQFPRITFPGSRRNMLVLCKAVSGIYFR